MIKRIIVLTDYPFNQRDYNRFGISSLRNNGFEVEIWDITQCIYNSPVSIPPERTEKFEGLTIFSEKPELVEAISSLGKNCLINCFVEYSRRTHFIFRAISKNSIKYCVSCMVSVPNPIPEQKNWIKRTVSSFWQILKKPLLNLDCRFGYHWLFGIAPPSIVLYAGEMSQKFQAYPMSKSTIPLWIHSLDYDIFLQNQTGGNDSSEKYGVFLDEYLPFHPDYLHMGIDTPITPENYYPKICSFFEKVETKFKTKIVIAAHPRSDYESHPDYFEGRTVLKGETAHLVQNSSFVISHMSTSINFAVLYRKPILFITTDRIEKMNSGKNLIGLYVRAFSSELGKIPINIDQVSEIDWNNEMKINEELYCKYEQNFIKKQGTPEKRTWDYFSAFILQNDRRS